jgi:hypothetical protein
MFRPVVLEAQNFLGIGSYFSDVPNNAARNDWWCRLVDLVEGLLAQFITWRDVSTGATFMILRQTSFFAGVATTVTCYPRRLSGSSALANRTIQILSQCTQNWKLPA